MGIHGFMKNMQQDEPYIKERKYESIYIDCNYLLHYFIYNCKNDNDLNKKINDYIKYLLETITVSNEIHLIFDGKHPQHLQHVNPKKMTHEKRYKNKKDSDAYDKQTIAPKTEIVSTFKTFIIEAINLQKIMYKYDFEIKINDDGIDDEADFKILNSIYESSYKNFCIISKDSDMILIAYSLVYKKKINIDILSNLRPIYFVDINILCKNYNLDYVLVIILLGNDYLPKLSNVDYDTIMFTYKKFMKHDNPLIIENDKINYLNFINYLTYIILNKKVKYKFENLNFSRFEKYYNNVLWCLKKYKVIENDKEYMEDTRNVINIYNFIYSNLAS